MKFRIPVFAFSLLATVGVSQYLYHPTLDSILSGSLALLVLMLTVTWSAPRLGSGGKAIAALVLVSAVLGFLFSQGLDVIYSLLATPAGMRFILPLEVAISGALILLVGVLARLLLSRPEVEK